MYTKSTNKPELVLVRASNGQRKILIANTYIPGVNKMLGFKKYFGRLILHFKASLALQYLERESQNVCPWQRRLSNVCKCSSYITNKVFDGLEILVRN